MMLRALIVLATALAATRAAVAKPAHVSVHLDDAIALTTSPLHRSDGIALLRYLIDRLDDAPAQARLALARALSWERRFAESLAEYDRLIDEAGGDDAATLRLERIQVVLWQGRAGEAERAYRHVLASDPDNVDALVGLSRALRWQGRPLAAREPASRAATLSSGRRDAREELASTYADAGLRGTAIALAGEPRVTASAELRERLAELGSERFAQATTVSGSSARIWRMAPRVRLSYSLPRNFELALAGGISHLQSGPMADGDKIDYGVVGWAVSAARGRMRATAAAAGYFGIAQYDAFARVATQPIDEVALTIEARRRPFMEPADPFALDERAFHMAGVAGAQMLELALALRVDEVAASVQANPVRAVSAYADARGMRISDGNAGVSASVGIGIDLLAPLDLRAVGLYARWDTFATGYRARSPTYYSPGLADSHSVGPELAVRVQRFALAASGGAVISLATDARSGTFVGGAVRCGTHRVRLALRADYRAVPYYRSWRGWLALEVRL